MHLLKTKNKSRSFLKAYTNKFKIRDREAVVRTVSLNILPLMRNVFIFVVEAICLKRLKRLITSSSLECFNHQQKLKIKKVPEMQLFQYK